MDWNEARICLGNGGRAGYYCLAMCWNPHVFIIWCLMFLVSAIFLPSVTWTQTTPFAATRVCMGGCICVWRPSLSWSVFVMSGVPWGSACGYHRSRVLHAGVRHICGCWLCLLSLVSRRGQNSLWGTPDATCTNSTSLQEIAKMLNPSWAALALNMHAHVWGWANCSCRDAWILIQRFRLHPLRTCSRMFFPGGKIVEGGPSPFWPEALGWEFPDFDETVTDNPLLWEAWCVEKRQHVKT